MDPFLIGVIGIVILIILLFSRMPIGVGMGHCGIFWICSRCGL